MKLKSTGLFFVITMIGACLLSGCTESSPSASNQKESQPSNVAVNIVRNGDLESPDGAAPEHWQAFNFGGSPPGEHSYDMDPAARNHTISVSLNEAGAAGWRQSLTLDPDSHWILTCRAKVENIAGRGMGAVLFFPQFRYMQPPQLRESETWTILSKELLNSGFTEMDLTCTLGAYGGNTGTAVFDDISLIKQPNPAYDAKLTRPLQWGAFNLRYDIRRGTMTSMKLNDHPRSDSLDFLGSYPTLPYLDHDRDHFLGDVAVDVKQSQTWQRFTTADAAAKHSVTTTETQLETAHRFPPEMIAPEIITQWTPENNRVKLTVTLTNHQATTMTVGSVDLPLPWNNNYCLFNPHDKNSQRLLYTRRVAEHKHICGVSSSIVACPMDGSTPFVLVTPGDSSSGIEFTYHSPDTIQNQRRDPGRWIHGAWPGMTRICFHSQGVKDRQGWDDWYLGHSSLDLEPGESRSFTLLFQQLEHRNDVARAVAENGGLGVRLIPGPAAPVGEPVQMIVTGGSPPYTVTGEATLSDSMELTINASGEQVVTVTDGNGRSSTLILMGLAPVDELLQTRTQFILNNQVYNNSGHALDGGVLCWNNRAGEVLADPNDMWGSGGYEGGVTDMQFMALKNLYQPDIREIDFLEKYIHNWLRGKLQNPETNGVAWTVSRPERVERGYNYIHVLNLYDAMARVAETWPDACSHPVNHYLTLWMDTFHSFMDKGVRYRDLGLMGRGNVVTMPKLMRRNNMETEAAEVEQEVSQWVDYWVTPPAYPYGSELFFDNTGYETVALYTAYDLASDSRLPEDLKTARKAFVEQTIAVTEAGRGRAPVWFWNDSDQRWWDAVRTKPEYRTFTDFGENCHHYMTGLNGYMLLDLYDQNYNQDETFPVGFSGLLTHLGRITDTGFAGMCFCPDPSSANYGLNQFTGDVGLGLWGGLKGLRCYVINDPEFGGNVCYGGVIEGGNPSETVVKPWPGCQHRLRWFHEQKLMMDSEGQVIRRVSRQKSGNRWLISLENNSDLTSQSRLEISGLIPGTWAVTWRINNGKELESRRIDVKETPMELQRKLAPGDLIELVLSHETTAE